MRDRIFIYLEDNGGSPGDVRTASYHLAQPLVLQDHRPSWTTQRREHGTQGSERVPVARRNGHMSRWNTGSAYDLLTE